MVGKWDYPTPRKTDCCECLHGKEVSDPYRWMEDPDAEETKAFVESQNKLTMPYLESCSCRTQFHENLTELYNYPKRGCPFKRGSKFYYFFNTGLQNQSVLYQQATPDADGTIFLDPNTLSEDGTVALGSISFSKDGSIMAYTVSVSGSDWKTIKFMTVEGKDLEDEIKDVKFSCLAWTHDNKGLFYNRFPKAATSDLGTETSSNVHQKLYFHKLGTSQSEDRLCVELPDEPHWMPGCEVSDCGKFMVVYIRKGCEPVNQLWVHELQNLTIGQGELSFNKIIDNFDSEYDMVTNEGRVFYLKTNNGASKYRVIAVDIDNPQQEQWREVIPARDFVLEWINPVRGDLLISCYMEDCVNKMFIHKLSGEVQQQINIPPGSVAGLSGEIVDNFIYFKFVSFINPGVIYHMDLSKGDKDFTAVIYKETPIKGFTSSDFVTKQIFFKSKDGANVPMFVTHHKDIPLDGGNPTLMYGYGGFNISLAPSYSVSKMMWARYMGGVFATVNLRGGGEYGDDWHHAGSLANKQNVFDDFISAGEALCSKGYTSPARLAIEGGSNGGLLVAACANQRPDLFKAVVCHVGVLDMYRFHKFTIGHAWMTEFGDPGEAEHFSWMEKYSPLHTIPASAPTYPATLLLTGDHDDRVVPLHSLKFIATLQESLGSKVDLPLMVRVDTKSGHGAGKPTSKRLLETADVYGFLARQLEATWHE